MNLDWQFMVSLLNSLDDVFLGFFFLPAHTVIYTYTPHTYIPVPWIHNYFFFFPYGLNPDCYCRIPYIHTLLAQLVLFSARVFTNVPWPWWYCSPFTNLNNSLNCKKALRLRSQHSPQTQSLVKSFKKFGNCLPRKIWNHRERFYF